VQLQAELNQPRAAAAETHVVLCGVRSLKQCAEARRRQDVVGKSKVRMIRQVEEFRAELQGPVFPELGVLENREVEIMEAGSAKRVASGIAKGEDGILLKGRRIQPAVHRMRLEGTRARSGKWIADEVGPVVAEAGAAVVHAGQDGKGLAGLQRK